jgi:hypothetical protein
MIPKFAASRPLEQSASSNWLVRNAELVHHSTESMLIRGMSVIAGAEGKRPAERIRPPIGRRI